MNLVRLTSLLLMFSAVSVGYSKASHSSAPFTVRIASPEADVLSAVESVTKDSVIRGTYQFDKDRTLTGAIPAKSSSAFATFSGTGKAFYKIANGVLAPVGFKESADIGTITVRYVVQSLDPSATLLTIESVFIESAHRSVHVSTGTVEAGEYHAIQEQLEKIAEERRKDEQLRAEQRAYREKADAAIARNGVAQNTRGTVTTSALQQLEQEVATLRRLVQARVRDSGTQLKAAPYRSAASITTLTAHTDVVLLVVTPYWYGVETRDGHHGWVHRDQLEALP